MNRYDYLFRKKERLVVGVLSGTSVDAADVILVKIKSSGKNTRLKVIDFAAYPFSTELKNFIFKCSSRKESNVEDICKLNFICGRFFAGCINKLLKRNKLKNTDIDLIGSHGQTIYHFPPDQKLFGFSAKSTLQVGDPSVIANLTGITTAGDFRTADVSAGGDGAPLASYLDYIFFTHKTKNRVLINIGGISNVTYLKKNAAANDVIAFDCGPGNMIIDYICKIFFAKQFDKGGKIAARGKVNEKLFDYIISNDSFHKKKFPKSTGREMYGEEYVKKMIPGFKDLPPEDLLATFTKFTAYAIATGLNGFEIDEAIVSGGGAENVTIMNHLREYFGKNKVRVLNHNGINSENKEAVLFAVLANELVSGNKANLPAVTGASKNVFLGKICFA